MEFDGVAIAMLVGVYLVMAGFTSSIDLIVFLSYIKNPKPLLIGLLCQFIILPLTAFILIKTLSLPPLESIGLIVTASCPGGTLSNFWCWYFGTDLALSIAMTTASSLLSFIFLTVNCLIYIPLVSNNSAMIDYASLTLSVVVLILGVITGLIIIYKKYNKLQKILYITGGIFVVVVILLGTYQNTLVSDKSVWELPSNIFLATIILNVIAWFISLLFSFIVFKLPNNQSIAVCVECCNQNVGLAISIVLLTINNKDDANTAVGVPMLYGALNALFILLLGTLFRIFGFIKNDNDGNYEKSGFTKCTQCCRKSENKIPVELGLHENNLNDNVKTRLNDNDRATNTEFGSLNDNDSI
eukprot:401816_1